MQETVQQKHLAEERCPVEEHSIFLARRRRQIVPPVDSLSQGAPWISAIPFEVLRKPTPTALIDHTVIIVGMQKLISLCARWHVRGDPARPILVL